MTSPELRLQAIVGGIDPQLTPERWGSLNYEAMPYRRKASGDEDDDDHPSVTTRMVLQMVLPPAVLHLPLIMFTLIPVIGLVLDREAKCKHQAMLMGLDVRLGCVSPASRVNLTRISPHRPAPPPICPHLTFSPASRQVRIYWLSCLACYALIELALFVAPVLVAAAAAGTVSAAAMPAFALLLVCSVPPILLFCFLVSFLFRTKEQATGFYVLAYMVLVYMPNSLLDAAGTPGYFISSQASQVLTCAAAGLEPRDEPRAPNRPSLCAQPAARNAGASAASAPMCSRGRASLSAGQVALPPHRP